MLYWLNHSRDEPSVLPIISKFFKSSALKGIPLFLSRIIEPLDSFPTKIGEPTINLKFWIFFSDELNLAILGYDDSQSSEITDFPEIIGIDAQQAFTGGGNVKYYQNVFENGWLEKETNIPSLWVSRNYHCELFDFDSDGNLDLILGGHEWEEEWMSSANGTVQWKIHIIKGLGDGQFDIENAILLPELNWWGIITDFDIYDIDSDGQFEIIITRTSGRDGLPALPVNNEGYDGHKIQILKNDGNNWYNWQLVDQPSEIFDNPQL